MTDYARGVEQASAVYKEVIREYVSENAKLRELCKAWRKFAYELFDECFGEPEANDDFMALDDRLREMGVEPH